MRTPSRRAAGARPRLPRERLGRGPGPRAAEHDRRARRVRRRTPGAPARPARAGRVSEQPPARRRARSRSRYRWPCRRRQRRRDEDELGRLRQALRARPGARPLCERARRRGAPRRARRSRRGLRESLALPRSQVVSFDGSVRDAVARLEDPPGVVDAQPNYVYHALAPAPNDTHFGHLWGIGATPGVGVLPAWDRSRGAGQVIAIVDTGVDLTHPDLARTSGPAPTACTGTTSLTATTCRTTSTCTGRTWRVPRRRSRATARAWRAWRRRRGSWRCARWTPTARRQRHDRERHRVRGATAQA